jgi:hypothetical protein
MMMITPKPQNPNRFRKGNIKMNGKIYLLYLIIPKA